MARLRGNDGSCDHGRDHRRCRSYPHGGAEQIPGTDPARGGQSLQVRAASRCARLSVRRRRHGDGFITFGLFQFSLQVVGDNPLGLGRSPRLLCRPACLILNAAEYAHADTRQRFLALFAAHGVESRRISFRNGAPDPVGMLQGYEEVDIGLDPMPYSGGLTTLEALYMGVPVITMPGRRFGSRHSAVHLRCIGLDDWIASDPRSYVAVATRKAEDILTGSIGLPSGPNCETG